MKIGKTMLISLLVAGCSPNHESAAGPAGKADGELSFQELTVSVFEPGRCLNCHSGVDPDGGVNLESREAVFAVSGLLVPGDAAASRLYQVLVSGEMPPRGPLPPEAVELVERWIAEGAR